MIHTYNEYHLGDQLVHLNFLRKACRENPDTEFTHHCNPAHHAQLAPLCEYVPITLADLSVPPGAHNAWIGRDNYYYNHPLRSDWVLFHLSWFDHLSSLLGISNPIAVRSDLLFDYDALKQPTKYDFDYLIINSPPNSGQLPDFHPNILTNKVRFLLNEGHKVVTTAPTGMCPCTLDHHFTVTDIGVLSNSVKHIWGVATGPMWTTFNIFNQNKVLSRTFYCAHQTVYLTDNTITKHRLSEN
jgi:hypothetical protein